MITISLSDKEQIELAAALDGILAELRVEIAHTDRREYREDLKVSQHVLSGIREKLSRQKAAGELRAGQSV